MKLKKPALRGGADIAQRVLIAAVINNPGIYNFVEEEFGGFEVSDPGLSKLRDSLISIFQEEHKPDSDQSLDTNTIKTNLVSYGLDKQMDDILCESVYIHAGFCMPQKDEEGDQTLDKVAKWKDIYSRLPLNGVANEIKMEWKSAFLSGDEESEAKIKETLSDLEKQSQTS